MQRSSPDYEGVKVKLERLANVENVSSTTSTAFPKRQPTAEFTFRVRKSEIEKVLFCQGYFVQ